MATQNNKETVNTVALFNEALDSLVSKLKQDRNILAAILFGSLSHDTVWKKSDIDIMLVGRDEKKPIKHFALVENGVNIHTTLYPRSKFKQALEGSLQGSFMHSSFSKSRLLFSLDETLNEYYQEGFRMGAKDRAAQLLSHAQTAIYYLAKAEKWFYTRKDFAYSFLWIMHCVEALARIEAVSHSEIVAREVLQQAVALNPDFFNSMYTDLIHVRKDEKLIKHSLSNINRYLDERQELLFNPILDYLSEAGGIRTTTELDAYFSKTVQADSLAMAYEWLSDKGVIQKLPSPLRLTEKSLVTVDEAAYYYDSDR